MGMDQYMYAVKNGVYELKDLYNWSDPLVDKIFVPATEIGYWRKNTALQHYFGTQCDVYTKISKQQLEQLVSNIERRWGEFDYPDYIKYNKRYDLEVLNNALGYISDDFSIYYEADW